MSALTILILGVLALHSVALLLLARALSRKANWIPASRFPPFPEAPTDAAGTLPPAAVPWRQRPFDISRLGFVTHCQARRR